MRPIPITATPAAILTFMDQYESTTNQIASERKFYNDAVREYNTAIRKFPNVLFAGPWVRGSLYYDQESGLRLGPIGYRAERA
jgi:hypothetical protein